MKSFQKMVTLLGLILLVGLLVSCQAEKQKGTTTNQLAPANASEAEVYDIIENKIVEMETRPEVKQKFIFIKPEKPIASVILFEGGKNILNLKNSFGKPSVNTKMSTLLIRNREDFAKQGLMVALVDTPSDMESKNLLINRNGGGLSHLHWHRGMRLKVAYC